MSCLLSRRSPVTCVILVSSSSGTFWPNMRLHGRPGVNPSTTPNRGSEAISCQGPAPQQRVALSIEHHPPPSSPQPMAGVAPQVSAVAPWAAPLLAEMGAEARPSEIHMAAHRPGKSSKMVPWAGQVAEQPRPNGLSAGIALSCLEESDGTTCSALRSIHSARPPSPTATGCQSACALCRSLRC